MHLSKEMIWDNSDTIVIFVHGFLGSPGQFTDIMDAVYQHGISAISVLLPGHGGTGYDFAKSTAQDWSLHLKRQIEKYNNHKSVFIIGHSIGGLLALNLSTEMSISGVVAISTPLKIRLLSPSAMFIRFKILLLKKSNDIKICYNNAAGVGKPFYRTMLLWGRTLIQPFILISRSKRYLRNVTAPVLTIHSVKDETCSFKSVDMFKTLLISARHTSIVLEKSLHAYYPKNERAVIIDSIIEFINHNKDVRL